MRELVVAVLLALVAIYANALPVEQQEQSFTEIAVEHYLKLCKEEILEDWLRTPATVGIEHMSLRDQADDCRWWVKYRDVHTQRFASCYRYGFDKMHERIRESTLGAELNLYDRRMKGDKICSQLQERVKKEFDNDWSKVPEDLPKPVDETLSVETCAERHLTKNKGFELPALFGSFSYNEQKNICEEGYERALQTEMKDCKSKYRVSDYLAIYYEQDEKSYGEIRKGLKACEEPLDIEWNWSQELPLYESAGKKASDEDSEE